MKTPDRTSLLLGAARDRHGRNDRLRVARDRRGAQAARRRLHRAREDADQPDHLLHRGARHRRRRRHEEGRPRRRQGAALLRGGVDVRAGHRPGRRQPDPAGRGVQRRSRHARRARGGRLRQGGGQPEHGGVPAARHSADVLRRLHRIGRPAAGALRRRAVRLRDDAHGPGRQRRAPGDRDQLARLLPHHERDHEAGAARGRRGDGVHDRPLRRGCAEADGVADGQLLSHLPPVRARSCWAASPR